MKIIKFRVYPESKRGHYYTVKVFPTIDKMQAYAVKRSLREDPMSYFGDALAAMLPFTQAPSKTLGEIIFHRGRLQTEIVTHEAGHAAFMWAREKKVFDNEERVCDAIGSLSSQIINSCYQHGLYNG